MPYRWTNTPEGRTLELWPHQSLTASGFVWFVGSTAALLGLPILAVLGSAVAWVLFPFFLAALWAIWRAIAANQRDRSLTETMVIQTSELRLTHAPSNGAPQTFEANPHWVRVALREDGPVEKYLTLASKDREVELGAFLTPEERESLHDELLETLKS